ncbi:MAG TPA: CheB methylesterase domain-containing protein, partial [Polyangiaceae bacterium]
DTGDAARNHKRLVTQLGSILRSFEVRKQLYGGLPSTAPSPLGTGSNCGAPSRIASRSVESVERSEAASEAQARLPRPITTARTKGPMGLTTAQHAGRASSAALSSVLPPLGGVEVVLVGCSTGGPQALAKIIPQLPANLGVAVLIVQHMPPVFTASMAESLNRLSSLTVTEASDGQLVQPNVVLIAPGGRHMTVRSDRVKGERRIAINDDPPVNSCRPSVDVLFRSAAEAYGGNTLSIVLTGMGEDGLEGVKALRSVGGKTLSQSEGSCVVFGMPRAIELAGHADEVVGLEQMASRLTSWLRHVSHRGRDDAERT